MFKFLGYLFPFLSKNDLLMAGEVLLNQNEESMALLVSAHGQPSVSNMILKYYLKSLFWLPSFPCSRLHCKVLL